MAQEKRNRSDTLKETVGAAVSRAELRRLGKAALRGAARFSYGAAISKTERDRLRKVLERAGSLGGAAGTRAAILSRIKKKSKGLTK